MLKTINAIAAVVGYIFGLGALIFIILGFALSAPLGAALYVTLVAFDWLFWIMAIGCTLYLRRGKKGALRRIALGRFAHAIAAVLLLAATLLNLSNPTTNRWALFTAAFMLFCFAMSLSNFRKHNSRLKRKAARRDTIRRLELK